MDIVTDQVLYFIAGRSGATLRHISLSCCAGVSDHGLCALARNCPLLEHVDLIGMENSVADACLFALAEYCSALRRARFSNCGGITSKGVQILLHECAQLTNIKVFECDRVGKDALRMVAKWLAFEP
jgi:F-box and leucine-rich repeat protein GRR1